MKFAMKKLAVAAAAVACLCAVVAQAQAQVKVGVIVSATGPAASIGVPERRVVDFMPRESAGRQIQYQVLDDATDSNLAVKAARKLIGDDRVDIVIGPSASAPTLAVIDVAAEHKTPLISMASSSRITSPVDDKRKWVFKTVMDESLMVEASLKSLSEGGKKRLAVIASSDAYGDVWVNEVNRLKSKYGVDVVSTERFASADVTVLAQVAKVLAVKPEAVLIAAAGTPAALPHKTLRSRGFSAPIVQTFGAAAPEVIKIGGKDMEGTLMASAPGTVPSELPIDAPIRVLNENLNQQYAKVAGANAWSPYAANAWTAWQLVEDALKRIPSSVKEGTPEFRAALRDSLERTKDLYTVAGIVTMSEKDHMGFDLRSVMMFQLRDGQWKLIGNSAGNK